MGNKLDVFEYITIGLSSLTKDNVEVIFNRTFQKWLFENSHEVYYLAKEEFNYPKFDEQGNITNVTYSGKTKNGIDLTEKQFIEHQLYRMSKLDYNSLKTEEKATFNFYIKFLENRGSKNKHPEIFKDLDNTQFLKFDYLYNRLSLKSKTKLSVLYHYFKSKHAFQPLMTQEDYVKWCEKNYGEKISKIFQKNYKHDDVINVNIPSLLQNFNQ